MNREERKSRRVKRFHKLFKSEIKDHMPDLIDSYVCAYQGKLIGWHSSLLHRSLPRRYPLARQNVHNRSISLLSFPYHLVRHQACVPLGANSIRNQRTCGVHLSDGHRHTIEANEQEDNLRIVPSA